VQQRPQRPFVPHRTPKASRQLESRSEFRLSRPFLPGSSREEAEERPANAPVEASASQYKDREQLPPIDVFLDHPPQHAGSQVAEQTGEYPSDFAAESDEPPPIEHFLDPLPAIATFAPDTEGALIDESAASMEYTSAAATARTATETGRVEGEWQQYDWRAAGALGDGVDAEASNDWAKTDWDVGAPVPHDAKATAAHAIASALDQIARRIREGELTVPPPGALTDPAAIAATLAALLGVRR
jgi:hypothetical protein